MKFGPVPIDAAKGAILAHSVPLTKGRLRKGHVLTAADLTALQAAGREEIIVAQLEPGDLTEDAAAETLAKSLAGEGLRLSAAATGRVNIYATGPGLVQIDAEAINAFNAINPMITVATVPLLFRVDAESMVATVKIISYAVPDADVTKAVALGAGALALLPPMYRTATLIETEIGQDPGDKGRAALAGRMARLGVALDPRIVVPHTAKAIADALAKAEGEVVFILTASATSDPNDVGPAGVRQAGGTITQFGMPVDPGNLLFLGTLGDRPVIGLPGCARSPALNGADWVLERVICGMALTPADFAAMGVGGLLKEIPTRPQPRADI